MKKLLTLALLCSNLFAQSQVTLQLSAGGCNYYGKPAANLEAGYQTYYTTTTIGFVSAMTDLSDVPMIFMVKTAGNLHLQQWIVSPGVGVARHAYSEVHHGKDATYMYYQINVHTPAFSFDPNGKFIFTASSTGVMNYVGAGITYTFNRRE